MKRVNRFLIVITILSLFALSIIEASAQCSSLKAQIYTFKSNINNNENFYGVSKAKYIRDTNNAIRMYNSICDGKISYYKAPAPKKEVEPKSNINHADMMKKLKEAEAKRIDTISK